MPFTYILTCKDGTLYCGSCIDMDKRLRQHNGLLKGGAKYTRGRRPVILFYKETYATLPEAMQREAIIKKLSRKQKISLAFDK